MACCIFKNCFNRPPPYSNVTFFAIPKDGRRQQWLQHSGNEELQNLPVTARRLVCEAHFEERHLRRQFHRTTLSRDAVPVSYSTVLNSQLVKDAEAGQPPRNDSGELLELVEIETTQTDSSVQEISTESENESIEIEVIGTEEFLLEEIEMPDDLRTEERQDTSKRKRFETSSTQTDDPETSCQSPPAKRAKCISLTTDQSTNTEPVPIEVPQAPEKRSTTTDQCTQTDKKESPLASPAKEQKTEDEYFMLSLLEPLQRLAPEKRAIAKVKMLTYLVQLGCGLGDARL